MYSEMHVPRYCNYFKTTRQHSRWQTVPLRGSATSLKPVTSFYIAAAQCSTVLEMLGWSHDLRWKAGVRGHSDGCGLKITAWGVGVSSVGAAFQVSGSRTQIPPPKREWSRLKKFHVIIQWSVTTGKQRVWKNGVRGLMVVWMTGCVMMTNTWERGTWRETEKIKDVRWQRWWEEW